MDKLKERTESRALSFFKSGDTVELDWNKETVRLVEVNESRARVKTSEGTYREMSAGTMAHKPKGDTHGTLSHESNQISAEKL